MCFGYTASIPCFIVQYQLLGSMECLSQVCSIVPCLWDCSAKHAAYVTDLEDNLNSLKTAMDELNNLNQDVKNRVTEAEEHNMKQTNRVNGWLQRVEAVEKEANQILQKGTQELENKCVGSCCPKNCWSSYKLGKKVLKMLPEVTGLIEKGQFDVVADKLAAPPVDEQPMENTVVGFESNFQDVWQCVEDQDLSIIGLVGIGGVGKTTLLKQLNNEFLKRRHGFDLVIWIVVSRPANLGRIRETIRGKLNVPDDSWVNKSEDQRVSTIFNKLKEKKFVVLLDDLWDKLELSELGIPQPCAKSMSKVMFTTRSHEVCQCMDAHKSIKVGCLPLDQALKLFYSKVGEDMLKSHEEIRELVKDVARECQGLPLALITIGQSMRGKTSAQQWKDAKRALQKYPSTFPGMGRVFSKLVFSYESLPTPTLQKCFEYCSIFPEDHNIEEEDVIKLWLAERLLDEYDTMYDAFIQGRQIIKSLVQSGLLEVGEKEKTVKMHDVIRDMALWLACERGEKKNKIWVDVVSDEVVPAAYNAKWRNGEKVSLWGPDTAVEFLSGLSFCSNLVTLIIRDTNLEVLPGEVFQSMKTLQVLDLSDNKKLIELPTEIGCLINLEYLNIIGTHVRRLPVEVAQLTKLRFLLLSYRTVTGKVLSSLCSLQTFEQNGEWDWSPHDEDEDKTRDREMLEQLEELKHIMDLCLVITSVLSFQLLLDSPKLQSCTRQLTLETNDSLPAVLDLSKRRLLEHVEMLHMVYCDMSGIKLSPSSLSNLQHVVLSCCGNILTLSSLVYIPLICTLHVSACNSIEELIGEGEEINLDTSLFSSLTSLEFWLLPKLRSICPQKALPFPSLKLLKVGQCGSLHKLPLDSNTAETIPPEFRIQGANWWWDQLQWDSEKSKNAFTPKFCPDQYYNTDSDSDSDSS